MPATGSDKQNQGSKTTFLFLAEKSRPERIRPEALP
jgi:hypothetical protein